jgi:hypothetical protein
MRAAVDVDDEAATMTPQSMPYAQADDLHPSLRTNQRQFLFFVAIYVQGSGEN